MTEPGSLNHSHVIPVDPALTPKEAWTELCIFGRRVTWTGKESWTVMDCDGDECHNIDEHSPVT